MTMPVAGLDAGRLARALRGEAVAGFHEDDGQLPAVVKDVCELDLVTGEVIAADPFMVSEDEKPFRQTVAPGRYRLQLVVGVRPGGDERIGLAHLRISDAPTVSWEFALTGDEDVSALEPGGYYGYAVDAGLGCFMDRAALAAFYDGLAEEDYRDAILAAVDQNYIDTRSWADWRQDGAPNVGIFSSGDGDGLYPTYVGRDAAGNITAFVTDFFIFEIVPTTE